MMHFFIFLFEFESSVFVETEWIFGHRNELARIGCRDAKLTDTLTDIRYLFVNGAFIVSRID